ncbi:uncharacterized protein LOC108678807 [Hyalella azteca]|uniref:Uncharacterized protein LOC108678807 n=1 Tax=Hyalella azteca TaxID=294128 RepID=A0A8B7P9X8_HYAAZ|nr:uncharacterized protein LOC108678807 [Hyalella azteca]
MSSPSKEHQEIARSSNMNLNGSNSYSNSAVYPSTFLSENASSSNALLNAVPYDISQCGQQYVLNPDGSVQVLMTLQQYEEQVKGSIGSEVIISQDQCHYVASNVFTSASECNIGSIASESHATLASTTSGSYSVVSLPNSGVSTVMEATNFGIKRQPLDPSQVLSVALNTAQVLQTSNLMNDSTCTDGSLQTFVEDVRSTDSHAYQHLQLMPNGHLQSKGQECANASPHAGPFRYSVSEFPAVCSSALYGVSQASLTNEVRNKQNVSSGSSSIYSPSRIASYTTQPTALQAHGSIVPSQFSIVQDRPLSHSRPVPSETVTSYVNMSSTPGVFTTSTEVTKINNTPIEKHNIDRYVIQVGKPRSPISPRPSFEVSNDGHVVIRTGSTCIEDGQVVSFLRPLLQTNANIDVGVEDIKSMTTHEMAVNLPCIRSTAASTEKSYAGKSGLSAQDSVKKLVQINFPQTHATIMPDNLSSDTTRASVIPDYNGTIFECSNCKSKFLRSTNLKAHKRSCRKPEVKTSEKMPLLMCSFCKETFKTKPQICHHLTVCNHSPLASSSTSSSDPDHRAAKRVKLSLDALMEQGVQYRCLDCDRTFNKQRQYSSHIKRCTQTSVQDMTHHTRATDNIIPLPSFDGVHEAVDDPFADPVPVAPVVVASPATNRRGYPRRRGGRRPNMTHVGSASSAAHNGADTSSPQLFNAAAISPGAVTSVIVTDTCGLVRSNAGLTHALQLSLDAAPQTQLENRNSSRVAQVQMSIGNQQDAAVGCHAAPASSADCHAGNEAVTTPRAIITNSTGVVSKSRVPEAWSLVCGLCEKLFLTRAALAVHVVSVHGPDLRHARDSLTAALPLPFKCPVCYLHYSSGEELIEHMVLQHAQHLQSAHAAATAKQKCVVCSVCSLVLATRTMLLEHMALAHMEEISRLASSHLSSHAPIGLTKSNISKPRSLASSLVVPRPNENSVIKVDGNRTEMNASCLADTKENTQNTSSSCDVREVLPTTTSIIQTTSNFARASPVSSLSYPLLPSENPDAAFGASRNSEQISRRSSDCSSAGNSSAVVSSSLELSTSSESRDTTYHSFQDTSVLEHRSDVYIKDDAINSSVQKASGADRFTSKNHLGDSLDHRGVNASSLSRTGNSQLPVQRESSSQNNCVDTYEEKRCSYMKPSKSKNNVLKNDAPPSLECGVCAELQETQQKLIQHYAEQHGVQRDADGCLLDLGVPIDIKIKDTATLFSSPESHRRQLPQKTVLMRPKPPVTCVCKECGAKVCGESLSSHLRMSCSKFSGEPYVCEHPACADCLHDATFTQASDLFDHESSSHPERCCDVIRRNFPSLAACQTFVSEEEQRLGSKFEDHQTSSSASGRVNTALFEYRICEYYSQPYTEDLLESGEDLSCGYVRIRSNNRCMARLHLRVQFNKKTGEANGETLLSYWPRHSHNVGEARPRRKVNSRRQIFGALPQSRPSTDNKLASNQESLAKISPPSNKRFADLGDLKNAKDTCSNESSSFSSVSYVADGVNSYSSSSSTPSSVERYRIVDQAIDGGSYGKQVLVSASSFETMDFTMADDKSVIRSNEQYQIINTSDAMIGSQHGTMSSVLAGEGHKQNVLMVPCSDGSYEVQNQGMFIADCDEGDIMMHNTEGETMEESSDEYVLPADENEWEKLFHHLAERLQSDSADESSLSLQDRAEAREMMRFRGIITHVSTIQQVNVFQKLCILTNTRI